MKNDFLWEQLKVFKSLLKTLFRRFSSLFIHVSLHCWITTKQKARKLFVCMYMELLFFRKTAVAFTSSPDESIYRTEDFHAPLSENILPLCVG